jgi:putative aminophosphonate oxidoreductase
VATRALWLEEALAAEGGGDATPLQGTVRADVCLVGGGYTGLWTAIHLKRHDPSLDVAVVEADVCGGGASGRNGGFVLSWWAKFSKLRSLCGTDEALRLARASAAAVDDIGDFCRTEGIDAHYRRDGWLWAATSAAQHGAWDSTVAELAALGERPFEPLAPAEVARRAGSATHTAGVFEPTAATVQPALLARGLRRVALARGVRIFERSPMTHLVRSRPPVVRTAAGEVVADRVVLALNAWAARLPELRRALVVIASDVVATAPIPRRLEEIGWRDGLAVSDSRLLVNYYRTTLDGRVVFGLGGGALAFGGRVGSAFQGASPRSEDVATSFRALYPVLADAPMSHSWTGPIDRSLNGLPAFNHLAGRRDIAYGVGFSGNGVGPSLIGGRILASLTLGIDDEWAAAGLVGDPHGSFPPEPVRYLGGRVVRRAVARKERRETAGRRPDRATLFLAGFAPAGLVPTAPSEPAAGTGDDREAVAGRPGA